LRVSKNSERQIDPQAPTLEVEEDINQPNDGNSLNYPQSFMISPPFPYPHPHMYSIPWYCMPWGPLMPGQVLLPLHPVHFNVSPYAGVGRRPDSNSSESCPEVTQPPSYVPYPFYAPYTAPLHHTHTHAVAAQGLEKGSNYNNEYINVSSPFFMGQCAAEPRNIPLVTRMVVLGNVPLDDERFN